MEWARGEQPVFTVGERTLHWADVLLWAGRTGAFEALARETAAAAEALERDGPPPAAHVREAAAAFRYARHLLAADELEAWLDGWGLTTAEWLDHVRRGLAGARNSLLQGPARDRDVLVDAVCSGALEGWARGLAERLAVAPDAAEDELERRFEAFRAAAVTDDAIAHEVDGRRLDWVRVEGEVVAVADADVAREIALCAREDGEPLDELAARAGGELVRLDAYLDDAEPALQAALLGARDGELLGPLGEDGRWLVALARRRTAPSVGDPDIRARAADRVLARALARVVERQVTWHAL
jgi:hypothetical protein